MDRSEDCSHDPSPTSCLQTSVEFNALSQRSELAATSLNGSTINILPGFHSEPDPTWIGFSDRELRISYLYFHASLGSVLKAEISYLAENLNSLFYPKLAPFLNVSN